VNDDQTRTETLILTAWEDAAGQTFTIEPPILIEGKYAPGTVFRARPKLTTPFAAAPGAVILQARLILSNGSTETLPVSVLTLLPTERNFAPPTHLDIEVNTSFSNLTTLLGATGSNLRLSSGQATDLILYWQAEASFPADYTIFVHLLGPDGVPVINADHAPPRPTTNWIEGEIVADAVTLSIPPDLPPGKYPLEVGLYNIADPNYTRLPLADSPADHIILTEIEVVEP
jgi:hypothetical protein